MHNSKIKSHQNIQKIINDGYPKNADEIPYLILYLGDQNSLGYDEAIRYLKSLGDVIIPYIKTALSQNNNDGELQTSLLFAIIKDWPKEWVEKIRFELEELVWNGNQNWEVDTQSLEILTKHKLADKKKLDLVIERKIENCSKRKDELERLRNLLITEN